jgi:hypothetical protein
MVSVIATGHKVRGYKPGGGDGVLRAIKARGTSSFGRKVKPSGSCRKSLRQFKNA